MTQKTLRALTLFSTLSALTGCATAIPPAPAAPVNWQFIDTPSGRKACLSQADVLTIASKLKRCELIETADDND